MCPPLSGASKRVGQNVAALKGFPDFGLVAVHGLRIDVPEPSRPDDFAAVPSFRAIRSEMERILIGFPLGA